MSVLPGPLPRMRLYTTLSSYTSAVAGCLFASSGPGDDVQEFERAVGTRLGLPYAIATPMARVAIFLVIRALIKPGQKVILSPYTIADVINMVVCAGGVPVFADIDRETCNISASEVEKLIDSDTGAVMVTHFYGLACDIERISAICRTRGVPLVEDAAQAFGAKVNGKSVGSFGAAGIFSFGLYKSVNSFLGGMVVTGDAELSRRLKGDLAVLPLQPRVAFLKKVLNGLATDLATFPPLFRLFTFWVFRFAYMHDLTALNNKLAIDVDPKLVREIPQDYLARMMPFQARLALRQLENVDQDTAARIRAAQAYHAGLRDLDELILPPMRTDGSHIYAYYPIQYSDRERLVGYAMEHFRDIALSHHRNCSALPCFREFALDCPNAEATSRSLIYLPTYPAYGMDQVNMNIRTIRRFFGRDS